MLTPKQIERIDPAELKALDRFLSAPDGYRDIRENNTVRVPDGSVDALAAAIDRAPEGGTVLLESGRHVESGTVMVTKRVTITGERGAVLEVNTVPEEVAGFMQPAIYVKGVEGVKIRRITLESANPIGGTGLIIEDAPRTIVVSNTFNDHQYGIGIENSDRCWIALNKINTSTGWSTGDIAFAMGIININGKRTSILGNEMTGGFLGSFVSDEDGLYIGNEMYGNVIGSLLCKVTPVIFPDGSVHSAELSCKDWLFVGNSSHDNFNIGYLVIDGASENDLQGNKAANNASYDIELAGESQRFGFTTPESFDNRVVVRENITVKDCGSGNTVIGGIAIDTEAEPCN